MNYLLGFCLLNLALSFAQESLPPSFEDTIWGPYETLEQSLELAGYRFEIWQAPEDYFGRALRIIDPEGKVTETEDAMIALLRSEADDLNQNAVADIQIQTYSGGAHCCFSTSLLELSYPAKTVFEHTFSECPANPQDLDGDGIAEFVSCDDRWAYEYCSYAESPLPTVVWQWNGEAYSLASQDFPQAYQAELARGLELVLADKAGLYDWPPSPECSALSLTLPYLYMNQESLAYAALKLAYKPEQSEGDSMFASFSSLEDFWQNILRVYSESPLRTPLSTP